VPIPVDVSRPLAASHRYPRHLFAAANFCGRFIRYAIIAALTFMLGELGWIATVALVAVAAIMILIRLVTAMVRRITKEEK
jgi:membrane protein DedA with SNARE-associated domain